MKGKKTGGRIQGTPNLLTKDIKEAYRLLIEKNLDNLSNWLEEIAEKDPEKAFKLISDLSEYIIPKQARHEFEGEVKTGITTRIIFKDFKKEQK